MLQKAFRKVHTLSVGSPLSEPKSAKRKLQEILRKYERDDNFIENINADHVIGFYVAIDIVKGIISDLLEQEGEEE